MQEAASKVAAWAKANPVLAGGLIVAAIVVGYFLSKSLGRGGNETGTVATSEEELGGGGGAGEDFDEILPLPFGEFILPGDGYIGGNGHGPTLPSTYVEYPSFLGGIAKSAGKTGLTKDVSTAPVLSGAAKSVSVSKEAVLSGAAKPVLSGAAKLVSIPKSASKTPALTPTGFRIGGY